MASTIRVPMHHYSLQVFPAPSSARVESGPIQFGEDWPGVFIRGDNAGHYAMVLQATLDELSLTPLQRATIQGLQRLLASAINAVPDGTLPASNPLHAEG